MEFGILVKTTLLSMFTMSPVTAGNVVTLTEAGAVNVLGCQSSIKNPMVLASVGSTWGLITIVVSTGSGGGGVIPVDFLQLFKMINDSTTIIKFFKNVFIGYVLIFNKN
jgi:hypothetical protein